MSDLDRYRLAPVDAGAVEAVLVTLLASAEGVEGRHIMRAAMRVGYLWQCVCKTVNYPRAQCCDCDRPRPDAAASAAPARPAPALVCGGCGRTDGHSEGCYLGGYVERERFRSDWTEL